MNRKISLMLVGAAVLALAAPAVASADPWWGHDGDHHEGWRDHDGWRDREAWRDHERWEHHGGYWGYGGYAPPPVYYRRCFIQNQGYYNWWGQYEVRAVRVCR